MNHRIFVLAISIVIGLQAVPAKAAITTFTGTFSVYMEGATASTPFSGSADVNLATGAFTFVGLGGVVANASSAILVHPLFTRGDFSLNFQPSVASFYPGGGALGGFGGDGRVNGTVGGCLLAGCAASTPTTWTVAAEAYNNMSGVIGVDGTSNAGTSYYYTAGTTTVGNYSNMLQGRAWTANTLSFVVNGRSYTALGGDSRTTTNYGGNIVLVTPIRLIAGMPNGGLGGYLTLDLSFLPVPEPGTAVLLGAGLVSLALAGRSRRARN